MEMSNIFIAIVYTRFAESAEKNFKKMADSEVFLS